MLERRKPELNPPSPPPAASQRPPLLLARNPVVVLLLLLLCHLAPSLGAVKRPREIFEIHLVRIQLPQRTNSSSVNLDACCAKGSWTPPEGCASRCRIFLRVCLLAKNHLDHEAGGAGVSVVSATDASDPVAVFPCTNALGDLTTGIVLKNNRLLNSSLDHQLQLKERNQGPFVLQMAVFHQPLSGGSKLLLVVPPIWIQLRPRRDWITHQLSAPSFSASDGASSVALRDRADQLHITLSYRFVCAPNYFGHTCERFCAPRDSVQGHYNCDPKDGTIVCLPGWRGTHCTEAICENGCIHGDCITPGVCKCLSGWQGETCNDCIPIAGCKHGACFFNWTVGHHEPFTCSCEPGWGGMLCSIDMKFCSNHPGTCQNGGICRNIRPHAGASPGYVCQCPLGFEGYHCERKNHNCLAHGCNGKGLCQESGNCSCFTGFYGANCQFNQTQCSQKPCQGANSVCREVLPPIPSPTNQTGSIAVSYRCECPANRRGTNCELVVNHCESNPCKHGGYCVDMPDGYQCVCLLGYKGRHCELPDSACQHLPCTNGGQCVDRANRVECICPPGWTGLTCRENVNECALVSEAPICKNGAACRDHPGTYECLCTSGWTGPDCSQPASSVSPEQLPPDAGSNRTCLGKPPSCKPDDDKQTMPAATVTTPIVDHLAEEVPGTQMIAVILTVLLLFTLLLALLICLLRYRTKHCFGLSGVRVTSRPGNTVNSTPEGSASKTAYFDTLLVPQEVSIEPALAPASSSSTALSSRLVVCPAEKNFHLLSGAQPMYGRVASTVFSRPLAPPPPTHLPIRERDPRWQQQPQPQQLPMPDYHFLPCPGDSRRLLALQPADLGHAVLFTCRSPPPAYEDLVPNPPRAHSRTMSPQKSHAQAGILTVRK